VGWIWQAAVYAPVSHHAPPRADGRYRCLAADTILDGPDRDLWERAVKAGKRITPGGELTVFKFPAAWRRNAYVEKRSDEQADYVRRIQMQPDFLYQEMKAIALAYANHKTEFDLMGSHPPKRPGWKADKRREIRGLERRALPPMTIAQRFTFWRDAINRRIPPRLRVVRTLKQALRRQT
jgi:hypothetical protein